MKRKRKENSCSGILITAPLLTRWRFWRLARQSHYQRGNGQDISQMCVPVASFERRQDVAASIALFPHFGNENILS